MFTRNNYSTQGTRVFNKPVHFSVRILVLRKRFANVVTIGYQTHTQTQTMHLPMSYKRCAMRSRIALSDCISSSSS